MCIIPSCAVVTVSRCQWYRSACRPMYKSIAVVDANDAILQIGAQINTLPEVMLTTAVMVWGNILSLRTVYYVLKRLRLGALLIERQGGLWMVLLVGHLT